MIPFSKYIIESSEIKALKHLYHPEELIFLSGSVGVSNAIKFIEDVSDVLRKKNSSVRVSRKFDGAPSLVFGHHNGKFFVGSKSVFNASPKINYTISDIEKNHSESPGLASKLKVALEQMKKVCPKNDMIYQGDFLFDESDIKIKKISGEDHYVFRPNTISYAVKLDSPMGKNIRRAKMGIVIHTYYLGLSDSAKFLPNLGKFTPSPDVFYIDAEVDLGDDVLLTVTDYDKLHADLSEIKKINEQLKKASFYESLDPNISTIITTFNNKVIRENSKLSPEEALKNLIEFISDKWKKEIDKVKTQESKTKKISERDGMILSINKNKASYLLAFKMYNDLIECKEILIKQFNRMKQFGTFIEDGKTFVPTNDEGFVAISDSGVVKLVSRMEFSRLNFTIAKTW